jgi:carbon storage regulator CsrA
MLVLTREQEESIRIGDSIVVKVLGFVTRDADGRLLTSPRVHLGIEAPKDMPIVRDDAVRKP